MKYARVVANPIPDAAVAMPPACRLVTAVAVAMAMCLALPLQRATR